MHSLYNTLIVICLLAMQFSSISCLMNKIEPPKNETVDMNIMEMVSFNNYPILQYRVTTADGYILTLHRMPAEKGKSEVQALKELKTKPKQAVLLAHGLFMNAASWVAPGPKGGIPYQLADTGLYDVWLINFRGVSSSREHMWLNPDYDSTFWQYSFQEFGDYDLKAALEFI